MPENTPIPQTAALETADVEVVPFSNDGAGWTGIQAVCEAIVGYLNAHPTDLNSGAKITACDARHRPARGSIFFGPDAYFPGPNQEWKRIAEWKLFATPNGSDDSVIPYLTPGVLRTATQIAATTVIVTNRADADAEARNTFVYQPVFDAIPPSPGPHFCNPNAWTYQSFQDGSNGNVGIQRVADQLKEVLRVASDSSTSAKVTADDRRHGDARGFIFYNPTMDPGDIQLVTNPSGWRLYTWDFEDAGSSEVPNIIVSVLNGGPLPNGVTLTWPQICSSRVLFTNRQEGNSDGASFALIYPLLP